MSASAAGPNTEEVASASRLLLGRDRELFHGQRTLLVNESVYRGPYDAATLVEVLFAMNAACAHLDTIEVLERL